jgi:hypothetical protein
LSAGTGRPPAPRPFGLIVLTLDGERISAVTRFEARVFPYFGLPRTLRV